MKQINQSPWVVVGVVLNLLVLGLLGWVIYQQLEIRSDFEALADQYTSTFESVDKQSATSEEASATELEISEWGLKSSYIRSDIKLKYLIRDSSIILTEEELFGPDNVGQFCDYGDIGRIKRYAPDEQISSRDFAHNGPITAEQFFENNPSENFNWKKIDSHYFMFISPQVPCSNKDGAKMTRAIRSAQELTKNLEVLE